MRNTRGRVAAGALLCALALAVVAASAQQNSAPLVPGKTAIVGRVIEAGGNTGVGGAIVTLGGAALGRPDAVFTNGALGGPRRVVADAQGQFVFRDLPPGSYNLDATAVGYVDGVYGQNRIIQIRRSLDVIRPIQVAESDQLVQATINLFRKGGISGRVVDEVGEPMVGIELTILARVTDWSGPVTQRAHNTTTDDRGRYHVDVVPGDYIVGVIAPTLTVPVEMVEMFVRSYLEGGEVSQRTIEQLTSSSGILPRGIGTKIGSLRVSQYGLRNVPVVPPMSAEGSWFYPSTYHPASFSAMAASVVGVASGEEKGGIDLQLRPVPARRVSGRIIGPDGPAAMFGIRLISSDPTVLRTSPATLIDVPQAMSDGNGLFTFVGVAPGAYTLYVIKNASAATQPALWGIEPVVVGGADLKDLEVRLRTGATITYRVVFEGAAPPTPVQVRNIAVTARPVPGSPGALTTAPSSRANADGSFTTMSLVPGPYQMTVAGVPPAWTLKSITTNGQNAVDRNFELTPSGISDMVVTFTDKRSIVTGLARNADGEPDAAATVGIFPQDRGLWRVPGMGSRRVQTAATQRDGRYTFSGLPDGDYYVIAIDSPNADFSDGQWLTKMIPLASRLTISGGQTVTQDLKVAVIR